MKMDQTTLNAAYKAVSEFTAMSGYYAKIETVNGLNFAMVCNNHIAQRAGQRMGLSEYGYRKEYILSKIVEFLSTSEDAMWDMMEYPEFCIIDERPNGEKHGYFCQNSYKTFGTTIINIVYVKTVVVKAPGKEVYRNNNEPLFVYENGNISFVETE